MCTALTYQTKDFYFGRNLDLEYSYHETITVTPRKYPLHFRHTRDVSNHYAMIGTAYVVDGYPLYYDATNEKGLSMAGLYSPRSAMYYSTEEGLDNVASFELIPWILGQCANLSQARALMERLNIVDTSFNKDLPATPLHWLIASREGALTLEPVREGLRIYDNPVGLLTNEPPFSYQMTNLANYMNLSASQPVNRMCDKIKLYPYSRGMGAIGLPGDLSSTSRFVRAAFTKLNSSSGPGEGESVSQFFHILNSVAMTRGCLDMGKGQWEITVYSSCCNADKGIYYYTTYENSQITAVDMGRENLDASVPVSYPMLNKTCIRRQN